jgi:hypothetical protein
VWHMHQKSGFDPGHFPGDQPTRHHSDGAAMPVSSSVDAGTVIVSLIYS